MFIEEAISTQHFYSKHMYTTVPGGGLENHTCNSCNTCKRLTRIKHPQIRDCRPAAQAAGVSAHEHPLMRSSSAKLL
jgi:hypothetical protein